MSFNLLSIGMFESNQDVRPQRTRKRQQRSPHTEEVGHSTTVHTDLRGALIGKKNFSDHFGLGASAAKSLACMA
jgi:hypothetical protein